MKKFGLVLLLLLTSIIYSETINGHTLPPEPDPKINNSTLLGIDSNNNGVRDDVERYIYERFGKDTEYPKTKIALAMQDAWATQKVLEKPVVESDKYYADALACQEYWINTKTSQMSAYDYMQYSKKHKVFNDAKLRDKMFNTKERVLRDFKFNEACSGNIFEGSADTIESCQTNIDELGE